MKDLKVGSKLDHINGKNQQIVVEVRPHPNRTCRKCVFYNPECEFSTVARECFKYACTSEMRKDKKNVYFAKA